MTPARGLARSIGLTFAFVLVGTPAVPGAQRAPRPPLVDAHHLRMQPEDAVGTVVVFGDPSRPGVYVIRNHFGPGQTSRPHYHDQDRFVTVIKGTWYTGEGDVFQPDTMAPIAEGGFMYHPAGFHHYDGARPGGTEDVVVQIMGMGPVATVQTEVDAQGNPVRRSGR